VGKAGVVLNAQFHFMSQLPKYTLKTSQAYIEASNLIYAFNK
jgi:hypothetical protein